MLKVQTAPWFFVDHQNIHIPQHNQRRKANNMKLKNAICKLTSITTMVFDPFFWPISDYIQLYNTLHFSFQDVPLTQSLFYLCKVTS